MRKDAMPTLTEHLANRRRRMVQLTTGLRVDYHLPDARRCLIRAGDLDLHGMTDEAQQLHRAWWYGRELIAEALERVDGFDVLADRAAIVELLDPADRAELLARLDAELAPPEVTREAVAAAVEDLNDVAALNREQLREAFAT